MRPSVTALAAGARVAGCTLAIIYLAGLTPGSLPFVIGGLALVTFGRTLEAPRHSDIPVAALAVGIVAVALGLGALRWGSLDLDDLRGAQAVLGPTLLVGPGAALAASCLAAGAALVALAAWFDVRRIGNRWELAWSIFETAVATFALATVFWGPRIVAGDDAADFAKDAGLWAAVVVCGAGIVFGLAWLIRPRSVLVRWLLLAVAATAILAGAGLVLASGA